MCGIVGLYLKNPELQPKLGALFTPMLVSMSDRGPDSAGFAIYTDAVPDDWEKFTLVHVDPHYDWMQFQRALQDQLKTELSLRQNANVATLRAHAGAPAIYAALAVVDASVGVFSVGKCIEIIKSVGLPGEIAERYHLPALGGSHIIGHTRMATESAVTIAGSHPFSTGEDLCLVHNGSLSNHNRLRLKLQREGVHFETDNDSEVAAGFLTWRLQQGDDLETALHHALEELDGFYTFAIGTREGFAVLRDPIACKPAVLAETDDYVAMGSEYRALADLPGIENAQLWEPEPGRVYVWGGAPTPAPGAMRGAA